MSAIFEIYTYADPHKGYGYGESVDFVATDDEELIEAFRNREPGIDPDHPSGEEVASKFGYEAYNYTARLRNKESLEEERDELSEKLSKVESALNKV